MDMNSRMAMAEKLSVQQLQQAIQSGSLPAYIGIPLIEQKNKEKSQMAAAQQGQQKPPSVASQILQQAEQGIDQLPSNLPTEQDEVMGMADGGIIAFAERGQVEDPEEDPLITALRQDPAYLAFAESGGIEGDTSLTAFLQAGNTPTPSRPPQSSLPMSSDTLEIGEAGSGNVYNPFMRGETGNRAALNYRNQRPRDRVAKGRELPQENLPLSALDFDAPVPIAPQPQTAPQVQKFPDEFPEEAASVNAGITAAPGARLAPDGTPGAPRTAPTGTGPKTAPTGTPSAPSSGRGALPPSLAAAERSDSPVADRATSMLDKYVAQLEKSGEDVGRQKKEALYMALIQGGLAAAGGMSPNALQNIAQGATLGAQNYQQALAGIRKDDRARLEKLISAGLKKEEFMLKAEEIGVKRDTARMVYDAAMARTGAMGGGGGSDAKKQTTYVQATRNYATAIGNIDNKIAKIKESQFYGMDPAKFPSLAGKIKGANDAVATFEKQKRDISREHQGFIKELGINVPDYENRPTSGNDIDLNQFFKKS
jgi:hypothetical protein